MIFIKRLKRPTKKSGYKLEPKKTTTVRGVVITNNNSHEVYVDKFKGYAPRKRKK